MLLAVGSLLVYVASSPVVFGISLGFLAAGATVMYVLVEEPRFAGR